MEAERKPPGGDPSKGETLIESKRTFNRGKRDSIKRSEPKNYEGSIKQKKVY